ncbi:MAG: translocation/assembly module TamB domain-containing protein [Negativicutes bacterium]|nr:translocation/assembly module TamB domain-containing protein [Negativicutes bacterium]
MRRVAMATALAVLVAALVILYGAGQGRAIMANAQQTLTGELSKAFSGAVRVGAVEVETVRTILLRDVSIEDQAGVPILTAPKVHVTYNPLRMLLGVPVADTVSEISLEAPTLRLKQGSDGRWNVDEILNRRDKDSGAFAGRVVCAAGTAEIATPQGNWTLEQVRGEIDYQDKPAAAVKLSAVHKGSPLTVSGRLFGKQRDSLAVRAAKLELADIQALLPQRAGLKLVGGNLSEMEIIFERTAGGLAYAGETRLEGLSADLDGLAVTDGRGLITFTDTFVYLLGAEAKLAAQPLKLSGKVALNTSEPVFDLTVSSPGFDPGVLPGSGGLRGAVAFSARLAGTLSRPVVSGEFHLAQGSVDGNEVRDAYAKLRLNDKHLTIEDVRATVFGGEIRITGEAETDTRRFRATLTGRNVALSQTGLIPGLTAAAAFELAVSGDKDLPAAVVHGTVSLAGGSWQGVAFDRLDANFYKAGADITIDYYTVRMGKGAAAGSGRVQNEALSLSLVGYGLPLAAIAKAVPGAAITGDADVEGKIAGSLRQPELKARFRAQNGQIYAQPFTLAAGEVAITPALISFAGVELSQGAARHAVYGSIALTGQMETDIHIVTKQARAENLVKLIAPGEQLTGNVDNTMHITGPLANVSAQGKFTLTEGSYRGYLIARSEGSYRRENGAIQIGPVTVQSLNTELAVSGRMGEDGELDLAVTATNIDLARLHVSYPYPVSGVANLTGKIQGRPNNIQFRGQLAADRMTLNGRTMEQVAGRIEIDGGQVNIPAFGFAQGKGRYQFAGGFNILAGTIFGSLDVENAELEGLLAILNVPAQGVAGKLSGNVAVSGALARPNVWLTGSMTNGSIKGYPLENIAVDVSLENQVLTINTFTAKQGAGMLAMRGTADLNGRVELEIGGRNIDAGLLTAWLAPSIDTQGSLSFTAQVTGMTAKPHTAVSLEIKGGGVSSATFDRLYGLLILENGSIHVNQVLMTKGPYRASAYGLIPLAALKREGRKQATIADQMDLKIRLDQADLSILPLLTKEVSWAKGETQGQVTIGGTLAQPLVYGSILVKDGTLKLKSLANPIQKVAVDIQFEGDKINIKSFDGRMGTGSYRLTGSTLIRGAGLEEYNLLLVLDKLGVQHKYFQGPVSGTLTLAQAGTAPKLSGRILLENDTIDVPYIPEWEPGSINIGLDLELLFGNKVRFHNPYMYDILATGKVKLGGTLASPAASGRIQAVRGTVSYLRTQFNIKDGSADFTQFGSFMPVIRLQAETRLERTQVNLSVNGPVNAMDIQLTSQPAMSRQEILSLLTLRSRYFDKQREGSGRDAGLSRDEVMNLLDVGLQMRFVAEMESAFRKAFGLDEFRFVRGTLSADSTAGGQADKPNREMGDREVYNLAISKYVTDRLVLNYSFGIDHKEYTAGFRYEINKRFSLMGETDERRRQRLGIETRFTF